MIHQHFLKTYHVTDRDDGKVHRIRAARFRIDRGRAGGPPASAENVRAEDKIFVRIERLAWTNHVVPPAGLSGVLADPSGMSIARERMDDEDGIVFRGVQLAVGLISDLHGRECNAALKCDRGKLDSLRFGDHRSADTKYSAFVSDDSNRYGRANNVLLCGDHWRPAALLNFTPCRLHHLMDFFEYSVDARNRHLDRHARSILLCSARRWTATGPKASEAQL